LFDAIAAKTRHMFMLAAGSEERTKVIEQLRVATDKALITELMEKLKGLEESERLLGFSRHSEEVQDRFQLAATYSDEWVKGRSKHGGGVFWIRMYWICQKHTHPTKWEGKRPQRCLSMTLSKKWHQNKEDPLDECQTWTCNCQREQGYSEGKFRAGHGVLVEMKVPGVGQLCYVRAEAPDDHVNDIRAIHYEQKLNPSSPEELYEMVPVAAPHATQVVRRHERWEGWYETSPEEFDALPLFDWYSVFSVTGMDFKRGLTNAQKKVQKNAAWGGEYQAAYNTMMNTFHTKEAEDKAALDKWLKVRAGFVGTSASSSA
jgi:hypothetical protein